MWVYKQKTGELFDPSGGLCAVGYSGGNCGKNPEGINNPNLAGFKKIGPIVCGIYTFGIPVMRSTLGPFAIPLIPDIANDMLGRSGFYMHGDTALPGKASEGCIIMQRAIRETCWNSDDHVLVVITGLEE